MLTFPISQLERFAQALLLAAGMDLGKAHTVARLLVLTDAMGRRTHGLAMAPLYLADIQKGGMTVSGEAQVIKDNGISAVWDGNYLPGLWLVDQAIKVAIPRAQTHGMAAVAIRKSHHIGCLAALVKQAADRGFVALIANSDPAGPGSAWHPSAVQKRCSRPTPWRWAIRPAITRCWSIFAHPSPPPR